MNKYETIGKSKDRKADAAHQATHQMDFLYEVEIELQKAKSLADMIQTHYMASTEPEDLKRWGEEREILWACIGILDDYINKAIEMVRGEQEEAIVK